MTALCVVCLFVACPQVGHAGIAELHGRLTRKLGDRPVAPVLQHLSVSYLFHVAGDATLIRDGRPIAADQLRGRKRLMLGKDRKGKAAFFASRIELATDLHRPIKRVQKVLLLRFAVEPANHNQNIRLSKYAVAIQDEKAVDADESLAKHYVWKTDRRRNAFSSKSVEVETMLEGKIVEVMEIYPLRLSLKTTTGRVGVQLQEDTVVTKDSQRIDPGQLRVGDFIRTVGIEVDGLLMSQEIIVVPSDRK